MSKVIHLSDKAHARAKEFCNDKALRMSDWVANLIDAAIDGDGPAIAPNLGTAGAPVAKRKALKRLNEADDREGSELVYAAPPFWAGRRHAGG